MDAPRPTGTERDGAWLMRIVFNRDEGRNRPEGLPPQVRTYDAVRCLMPVDPVSNGTWIAANEFGLVFFLLNHYLANDSETKPDRTINQDADRPSRGTIIPRALPARSLEDAREVLNHLTVDPFAGFRLVVADATGTIAFTHRPDDAHFELRRDSRFPQLFVSSGLGDELVETPRRALFDEMFAPGSDPIARQLTYQRHSWAEAQHVSVCMRRTEACTVSQTIIDLFARRVRMKYLPGPPDEDPTSFECELDRAADE